MSHRTARWFGLKEVLQSELNLPIGNRCRCHHTSSTGHTVTAMGGTEVLGAATAVSAYSLAEGYTNVDYNEWLTIQNPTATAQTITLTIVNAESRVLTQSYAVAAHSRFTVDITALVLQHLIVSNDSAQGYEVSLSVQGGAGGIVVERPMYWNTGASGTQGGSDVIGYNGY